ncbi:MAG: FMN-binding glutamate synthase family protein, partial [Muricauda sp.]|nr:FMN-binding glutamate synthase family protein [Allomuricauda sp.]
PIKSVRLAQYFKTFRKELLEITHAAGYEHPCQFNMDDVQVNVDDDYLSSDLKSVYGYQKEKVNFNSMQQLFDCEHLGGKKALEKTF